MTIRTRFAPSPTGLLHIGGVRTALFNYLYARHNGGEFLIRIEDTDKARSTPQAVQVILDGLAWLDLTPDLEPVFQSNREARHVEVAKELLAQGRAYYCYCTPEELREMRETAQAAGQPPRYNGYWRDRDAATAPAGTKPTIRLKAPREGETVVEDLVQGVVRVANTELDDMIILRSDGSPTYLHAVVVDDHDMGISHVIRGDDHLTNTFRQAQTIYQALGWGLPKFAHIPLIHGADGAKLSKRHGAVSILEFREQGFLPEALCNYLLRLGWGHGDAEFLTRDEANSAVYAGGRGACGKPDGLRQINAFERYVVARSRRRSANRGSRRAFTSTMRLERGRKSSRPNICTYAGIEGTRKDFAGSHRICGVSRAIHPPYIRAKGGSNTDTARTGTVEPINLSVGGNRFFGLGSRYRFARLRGKRR